MWYIYSIGKEKIHHKKGADMTHEELKTKWPELYAMTEKCMTAKTITIDGTTAPCAWDAKAGYLVITNPVSGKAYATMYPKELLDPAYEDAILA